MSSVTAHTRLSAIVLTVAAVFALTVSAGAQEFPAVVKTQTISSVMDAPSLILQPAQTISRGSSAVLCAYVRGGLSPFKYHWYAESNENGGLVMDSTSQYTAVKPEGNTIYHCTVTDASNRIVEGSVAITVVPTTASSINISKAKVVQGKRMLDFRVLCGEQLKTPVYDFTRDNLIVTENGVQISDFTLSSAFSNPLSAVLVIDCSGSMSGAPLYAAQMASKSFVSNMDGVTDEAALIGFSTTVSLVRSLTNDKILLKRSIDSLYSKEMTAVWDAAYRAVEELAMSAVNSNKVVVLLSDGCDNSSTYAPGNVISIANANSTRIYTIGLGGVSTNELATCAASTGGVYLYAPTPAQLDSVFGQIFAIARTTNGPCCRVLFNSNQPGNPTTTVGISTRNLCDGIPASATVDIATGVDPVPVDPQLTLSPNPANGAFVLSMYVYTPTVVQMRVIDALGRIVYMREQQALPGQLSTSITLPQATPGMYMLHVSGVGVNVAKKLVVQ